MKQTIIKLTGWYLNTLAYIAPSLAAKKGFQIFCTPFAPPIKPYQYEFLQTARCFDIEFEQKKVQCYQWGNGSKKVVLLHGWASNTFRWKKLIELLQQQDCTIYAMDAPAHGLSEGKTLHLIKYHHCFVKLLDHLGNIDAIVGHSIGAFMALYTLHQNPESQHIKTVMMGAPGEAQDFLDFYRQSLKLNERTIKIISQYFIKELQHPASYYSSARLAPQVHNPVLVIHDKGDKDTRPELSIRLSELLPNGKLTLTEGLGHALKSDVLNQQITRFILEKTA
jgi:pimeloyl-ACP methyl ester carboxylesterase